MAESSFPWTDGMGDGGSYAHSVLDNFFEKLFTTDMAANEGVLVGDGGELAVTGTASPVSVAAGSAVVKGKFYISTAATNVAIPTPTTYSRIDRIVLRSDFTAQTIRITRIAGTEAESPTAPDITQIDGTTWDIKLAQVLVTPAGAITVTDERSFCHFGTAVNGAMLDTGAVTETKLASSAVTTAKVADGAITAAKTSARGRGAFVWTIGGRAAVAANAGMEFVAPFALTLTGGYIIAKTAPTGQSLIMDVHYGSGAGTTIFTTQANRPTLADGSTGPTAVATPDVTSIAAGTRLFCAIDQVGSTEAGADLTLIIAYKYSLVD